MAHNKAQILKVYILLMWKNHGKYLCLLCWLKLCHLWIAQSTSSFDVSIFPDNHNMVMELVSFKIATKKCIIKAALGSGHLLPVKDSYNLSPQYCNTI